MILLVEDAVLFEVAFWMGAYFVVKKCGRVGGSEAFVGFSRSFALDVELVACDAAREREDTKCGWR